MRPIFNPRTLKVLSQFKAEGQQFIDYFPEYGHIQFPLMDSQGNPAEKPKKAIRYDFSSPEMWGELPLEYEGLDYDVLLDFWNKRPNYRDSDVDIWFDVYDLEYYANLFASRENWKRLDPKQATPLQPSQGLLWISRPDLMLITEDEFEDLLQRMKKTTNTPHQRQATDIADASLIHIRERASTYDQATGERSAGKVAIAFNAITGKDLQESEVWLILQLVKDVRQWSRSEYHRDSAEDCIAYAALKAEALENRS